MKKTTLLLLTSLTTSLFAESFTTSESIKVNRSEPVFKTVTTQKPLRDCWQESEQVVSQGGGGNDVIGSLVGGALGGVLGNQVGQGSGKTAATIGGAIVGSMLGQGANRGNEVSQPRTVEKCTTRYETSTQQVLSGYNNYGKYQGREIVKFNETPLDHIIVYTNVSY